MQTERPTSLVAGAGRKRIMLEKDTAPLVVTVGVQN